jgi:hypothetical protein
MVMGFLKTSLKSWLYVLIAGPASPLGLPALDFFFSEPAIMSAENNTSHHKHARNFFSMPKYQ